MMKPLAFEITNLPTEIGYHILSLVNSKNDLLNLCLVSKIFLDECQRLLFRNVELRGSRSVGFWVRSILDDDSCSSRNSSFTYQISNSLTPPSDSTSSSSLHSTSPTSSPPSSTTSTSTSSSTSFPLPLKNNKLSTYTQILSLPSRCFLSQSSKKKLGRCIGLLTNLKEFNVRYDLTVDSREAYIDGWLLSMINLTTAAGATAGAGAASTIIQRSRGLKSFGLELMDEDVCEWLFYRVGSGGGSGNASGSGFFEKNRGLKKLYLTCENLPSSIQTSILDQQLIAEEEKNKNGLKLIQPTTRMTFLPELEILQIGHSRMLHYFKGSPLKFITIMKLDNDDDKDKLTELLNVYKYTLESVLIRVRCDWKVFGGRCFTCKSWIPDSDQSEHVHCVHD